MHFLLTTHSNTFLTLSNLSFPLASTSFFSPPCRSARLSITRTLFLSFLFFFYSHSPLFFPLFFFWSLSNCFFSGCVPPSCTWMVKHPTDHFTDLEPQNPQQEVPELHKTHGSPDPEAHVKRHVCRVIREERHSTCQI